LKILKWVIKERGKMQIYSADFRPGGQIPPEFTCDGEGRMPSLEVTDIPESAKSMALVIEDPDAPSGTFTHFTAWNIPIGEEKGVCKIANVSVKGRTSSGGIDYVPPCPPRGKHRYFFRAYALDTELTLPQGASRKELDEAIKNHLIKEAELFGTYER